LYFYIYIYIYIFFFKINVIFSKKNLLGPKSGFICDKINIELKKMLEESDIPCEIEDGDVIVKAFNSSTFTKDEKDLMKEKKKFKIASTNNINEDNIILNSLDKITEKLIDIYKNCIKSYKFKSSDFFENINNVFSLDDFKFSKNPFIYNDLIFEKLNGVDTKIEFGNDYRSEIVPIDFNLISDFYKYSFSNSLVINPGILVMKIKQKIVEPSLLFAIYACACLYRPNYDKKKFNYFLDRATYCLSKSINNDNIQNLQASYIVSLLGNC